MKYEWKIIYILVRTETFVRWDHEIVHGKQLTLNVRGPSYLGLTRSISWFLTPWLLASPGHQQPWYWLCKTGKSWSYMMKNFNYLIYGISVWRNDMKCKYMFMFPLKNLARKELSTLFGKNLFFHCIALLTGTKFDVSHSESWDKSVADI